MRTKEQSGSRSPAYHHHRYNGTNPAEIARLADCTEEEINQLIRRDWFTRSGHRPELIHWGHFGVHGGISISKQCLPRLEVGLRMLRAINHRDRLAAKRAAGVYIVRSDEGPVRYKIGFASRLEERMSGLRAMSPVALTVVAFAPGKDVRYERRLHRVFRNQRLHGEWFEESPALLAFIDRYRWEEK